MGYRRDADETIAAAIPVERIQGPVLLVSGEDDQLWPSKDLADMVFQRLVQHAHPYPFEHLSYRGAGHAAFGVPDVPTYGSSATPLFVLGGTPAGNARARADSWPRMLAFLREHL